MKKLIVCLLLLSASVFNVAMASPWGCFQWFESQNDAHLRSEGIYFGNQNDGLVQGYWFIGPAGSLARGTEAGQWIINIADHCSCTGSSNDEGNKILGLCGKY